MDVVTIWCDFWAHEEEIFLWKILTDMGYQTTLPIFWETCMQAKKQQLESNIKQQTGSKLEKECIKTVYFHIVTLLI